MVLAVYFCDAFA
ncbi:hypothetical protein HND97_16210 [Vibrio cholerae]|nr:hypothetical protein HND97_16210 [Vibrio cholerae]